MADTIEQRRNSLEEFMTELPELLNLRSERTDTVLAEITARQNLMDRQIATLTCDVREVRAAVTRQLIAQDQRLARFGEQIESLAQQQQVLAQQQQALAQQQLSFEQNVSAKLDELLRVVQQLQSRPAP